MKLNNSPESVPLSCSASNAFNNIPIIPNNNKTITASFNAYTTLAFLQGLFFNSSQFPLNKELAEYNTERAKPSCGEPIHICAGSPVSSDVIIFS